eukprot:TRINITY_DN10717_c0_g1_i1.p1 TRINITY_DN10717_c0_g1~~TRINITY_DN10717_c0_g1_i1.p1  ORF type:complete len:663 (+),score=105.80 TRINITY_DN10717_c0_g1_i1:265-1989(+)
MPSSSTSTMTSTSALSQPTGNNTTTSTIFGTVPAAMTNTSALSQPIQQHATRLSVFGTAPAAATSATISTATPTAASTADSTIVSASSGNIKALVSPRRKRSKRHRVSSHSHQNGEGDDSYDSYDSDEDEDYVPIPAKTTNSRRPRYVQSSDDSDASCGSDHSLSLNGSALGRAGQSSGSSGLLHSSKGPPGGGVQQSVNHQQQRRQKHRQNQQLQRQRQQQSRHMLNAQLARKAMASHAQALRVQQFVQQHAQQASQQLLQPAQHQSQTSTQYGVAPQANMQAGFPANMQAGHAASMATSMPADQMFQALAAQQHHNAALCAPPAQHYPQGCVQSPAIQTAGTPTSRWEINIRRSQLEGYEAAILWTPLPDCLCHLLNEVSGGRKYKIHCVLNVGQPPALKAVFDLRKATLTTKSNNRTYQIRRAPQGSGSEVECPMQAEPVVLYCLLRKVPWEYAIKGQERYPAAPNQAYEYGDGQYVDMLNDVVMGLAMDQSRSEYGGKTAAGTAGTGTSTKQCQQRSGLKSGWLQLKTTLLQTSCSKTPCSWPKLKPRRPLWKQSVARLSIRSACVALDL